MNITLMLNLWSFLATIVISVTSFALLCLIIASLERMNKIKKINIVTPTAHILSQPITKPISTKQVNLQ